MTAHPSRDEQPAPLSHLGRGEPVVPIDVVRAQGSRLWDRSGRDYVDFVMGWCVGNLGWGNKTIRNRLAEFRGPEYVAPALGYQPWEELARRLAKLTPGDLAVSYRATGGTEAVEIALQAAMSHTGRSEFLSVAGSYHGHSLGTLSIGSAAFRRWYPNLLPGCHQLTLPLGEQAAERAEQILATGKVAAVILEPIICNLGVTIPEPAFMARLQTACRATGTLLIADEVATGFGRTGKLFASEHYNLAPDIMTLGKGVTGGYGALGATIVTPAVATSFAFDFSFYSTFGWHPLAVEAALGNLDELEARWPELEATIEQTSRTIIDRLNRIEFGAELPAVRVKGLAIAALFAEPDYGSRLAAAAQQHGVLVSTTGGGLTLFPALTIDAATLDEGLNRLERAAKEIR